ncbi:hypothetical protein EJB05_39683, partial [Eragrostis curvula]
MADASASSTNQSLLSETSSSCHIQAITAAHNFEVINFSLLEGMGVGKFVSSRNFSVGDSDWNIRLYPDGIKTEHTDYASAFLILRGGKTGARVTFSLSLFGRNGQVKLLKATHAFMEVDQGWGFNEFMKRSDLQPQLRLNNDSFRISRRHSTMAMDFRASGCRREEGLCDVDLKNEFKEGYRPNGGGG